MEKRIYLAGPDVFYPDAIERASKLKEICSRRGLIGIFPLDADLDLKNLTPIEQGRKIYWANMTLIDTCDAVLANMSPFRGPSMDTGTAYEMGVAGGQGKPVVGYTSSLTTYDTRVPQDGLLIERFDMIDNLMVHTGARAIFSTPEEAASFLATLI
jgi:nucleoside 2-deoxyribosyltransferase